LTTDVKTLPAPSVPVCSCRFPAGSPGLPPIGSINALCALEQLRLP